MAGYVKDVASLLYTLLNVGLCGLCGLCVVLGNLILIYNFLIWGTKGPKRSKKDQKDVPGEPLSPSQPGVQRRLNGVLQRRRIVSIGTIEYYASIGYSMLHVSTNVSNTDLYEATCRHGRGWNVHQSRYIDLRRPSLQPVALSTILTEDCEVRLL